MGGKEYHQSRTGSVRTRQKNALFTQFIRLWVPAEVLVGSGTQQCVDIAEWGLYQQFVPVGDSTWQ